MTFKLGPISNLADSRIFFSAPDPGKCSKCRRSFEPGTLVTLKAGKFIHGAFCWRDPRKGMFG